MNVKDLKSELKISPKVSSALVKLNLSEDTVKCYQALLEVGVLSSEELAKRIGVLPSAVYRLTNNLEKKGLIIHLDTYPIQFQAISPEVALNSLANNKIKEIEEAKVLAIQALQTKKVSNPQTKIDILTGWESMMNKYVDLAKEAEEEILIISIGEPVPDEVKLANRDALEKNINIKFIIHKYDKENQELIRAWVKMGIEVHYFVESGYHLVVVDGKKCILSSSNPDDSQERTSVVIYGEGLSKAMQQYFYTLWKQSSPVIIS